MRAMLTCTVIQSVHSTHSGVHPSTASFTLLNHCPVNAAVDPYSVAEKVATSGTVGTLPWIPGESPAVIRAHLRR